MQRTDLYIHFKFSRIHVQFFIRIEGKTHVLTVGVGGLTDDDVGGGLHLERGWDQELGLRFIGIDVISAGYAERERDGRWFALHGRHDWGGRHLDGGALRAEIVLR